jgi:NAD(P)-dependent dehydrogenase (short-subunit alcohol dehydrogenase family)
VKGTEVFESVPEGRRLEMLGNARTGAFTTPEEVAETIVWLALHSPANMTGAIVDINGGAYLR